MPNHLITIRVVNSREGNKFPRTRSGFDPIGLPNVLVVAIVWPPTVSRICLSLALLLCNHHQQLRRTWSVCSLPANSTVVSSPPLPSHKPEHVCVWPPGCDMESWWWERLTGDQRHPRHPVFMAGLGLRVDLLSEAWLNYCRLCIVGDCMWVSFRRHQNIESRLGRQVLKSHAT